MSEMKHTAYDLAQMQSLPLEAKIRMTQRRIKEWYDHWDGNVYVSFSGGKDSTVLLHIVREMYPDVPAVFVDTGLEYPEIKAFVKGFDNVTFLRPKMSFRQVIKKYGYPLISKEVSCKIYDYRSKPDGYTLKHWDENSDYVKRYGKRYCYAKWIWLRDSDIPISHKCCAVMKKAPSKSFEKRSGLKPYIGSLAAESALRKTTWQQHGCNAFEATRPTSNPLSFWTEQDILRYIKENNISIASVYGEIIEDEKGKLRTTKCDRTGCVFCAFGAHLEKSPNRFERLKQTHPQLWEYCMKPWDEGGLGMREVLTYCGIKTGDKDELDDD